MKAILKDIISIKNFTPVVLYFAIPFLFLVTLLFAVGEFSHSQEEYSLLAESLLQGELHLNTNVVGIDMIKYKNHIYWPLGPLPAILIAPATLITDTHIQQSLFEFFIIVLTAITIFTFLVKHFAFSKKDAAWLTIGFMFASVYAVIPIWYASFTTAHAVSVLLLFLALYEFYGKKRYYIIGILFAGILMTRFTASIAGLFFLLEIFSDKSSLKEKLRSCIELGIPVIVGAVFIGWYNLARFGSVFETGYGFLTVLPHLSYLYEYGLFDLRYIPSNIYYYFLDGFRQFANPNFVAGTTHVLLDPPYFGGTRWGSTSIFITSPLMLYAFFTIKDRRYWNIMAINGLLLLIFLSYYYNGWPQVGPRYTLDFMPLLFILVVTYFKNHGLSFKHHALILFSSILNLYLAITMYLL